MRGLFALLAATAVAVLVIVLRPGPDDRAVEPAVGEAGAPPSAPSTLVELDRPSALAVPEPAEEERVAAEGPQVPEIVDDPEAEIVVTGIAFDRGADGALTPAADAGISVEYFVREGRRGGTTGRTATTDSEGRFRCVVPDPCVRPVPLKVRARGDSVYRSAPGHHDLHGPERRVEGIRLVRVPHGVLAGVCEDPSGARLAGVEIVFDDETEKPPTTTSAGDGSFSFPGHLHFHDIPHARLDGHALLYSTRPRRIAEGGWTPIRIVLAPAARVELAVLDRSDRPLVGARALLRLADEERREGREHEWADDQTWADLDESFRGDTDDAGRVTFPTAWSGRKLEVRFEVGGKSYVAGHVRDGELVVDAGGGAPFVVRAGESVSMIARIGDALRLRGRVLDAARKPLAHAAVGVRMEGVQDGFYGQHWADAEGLFSFDLYPDDLDRPLELLAGNVLPTGFLRRAQVTTLAFARVDPRAAVDGELWVEVVCQPALGIGGTIRNAGGSPFEGYVEVVSSDELGVPADVFPAAGMYDGRFSIHGLLPGEYTLVAVDRTRDGESVQHYRGIAAGTTDLELVFDDRRPVEIVVRLPEGGPELPELVFALGTVRGEAAHAAEGAPRRPPPRLQPGQHEIRTPGHWPPGLALNRWTNFAQSPDGKRTTWFQRRADGERSLTFDAQPEGVYSIGAFGQDASGRLYGPLASAPANLTAGRYELVLTLPETGSLAGRVHGAAPGLLVALRTAAGHPLAAVTDGSSTAAVLPLDADGGFRLDAVPVGVHELWIGTDAELEAGTPRTRRELAVRAGENPTLEIQVD